MIISVDLSLTGVEWALGNWRDRKEGNVKIGRFIRGRRVELGLSSEKLGRMVGLSHGSVTAKERGVTCFHPSELPRFAKALNIPLEVLQDALLNDGEVAGNAPAGPADPQAQELDGGASHGEGRFTIRVIGDSMEPELKHGDRVVFESVPPDADGMPDPGCVAYVCLSGDSATPGGQICRWYPMPGGAYRLAKDNPAFTGMVVPAAHVEQFAVAVEKVSEVGVRAR